MTTRYVALLRAINLGATRRVSMPLLRQVLAERGYGAVRTHLASGNVILDSTLGEADLAADLTAAIAQAFALDVPVIVRTAEELADVVAADPLGHLVTEPARYSVSFFAEAPDPDHVATAPPADDGAYELRGRELYLWLPGGIQRSPTGGSKEDRLLVASGTNRNWNTVRKLVELTR